MYYLLIAVHVIVCIFLIITILLQAGKGGGLTESFSGQAQSVLGTQAPTVLKRATEVCAILFIVLSLVLAMMTSRRSQSLMYQKRFGSRIPIPAGMTLPSANTVPAGETAPVTTGAANIPAAATIPVAQAVAADPAQTFSGATGGDAQPEDAQPAADQGGTANE
ncbi:MAG: preprotein translocase subunit SecG [Candidatus Omnitrophica bacterium]|nr:preprotein translocase subunit SecG [Candidatus Omnitrophota bacterium]